jgi:hypothetical protein
VSSVSRWRDSGHPGRAVDTARGQQALDAAVIALLDDARSWRLAGMRKRRGLTQEHVAARAGASVARASGPRAVTPPPGTSSAASPPPLAAPSSSSPTSATTSSRSPDRPPPQLPLPRPC